MNRGENLIPIVILDRYFDQSIDTDLGIYWFQDSFFFLLTQGVYPNSLYVPGSSLLLQEINVNPAAESLPVKTSSTPDRPLHFHIDDLVKLVCASRADPQKIDFMYIEGKDQSPRQSRD